MEFKRLGDIATYINGYAFKPEQWSNNGRPIIRIQNLNNKDAVYNYFDGDINDKYVIRKGDILISWSASIGVYIWDSEEALLNQHIFKVNFDKDEINKIYFKYIVEIALNRATKYMHGSTMKHITKKYFDDILIPIPSLEIQNKIAEVLDKAQELIDKRKEQIEALDELVKSRFIEMFGEWIYNRKNMYPLSELCNFIDYRGKTPEKSEEGIPLITAKNVKKNSFSFEPREYVPSENYNDIMTRGIPKVNDILFTTEAPLGNVCRIPKIEGLFCVGQRLITMQPLEHIISEYLEYVLLSETFQNEIWKHSSGSTVKGIKSKELVKLSIPVPPMELQNQFADFVNQVGKLKSQMETSLKELEDNFNSLIQKAFKGELF